MYVVGVEAQRLGTGGKGFDLEGQQHARAAERRGRRRDADEQESLGRQRVRETRANGPRERAGADRAQREYVPVGSLKARSIIERASSLAGS